MLCPCKGTALAPCTHPPTRYMLHSGDSFNIVSRYLYYMYRANTLTSVFHRVKLTGFFHSLQAHTKYSKSPSLLHTHTHTQFLSHLQSIWLTRSLASHFL
uniref:Uncharacterized protein n=1 Tax=Trypanosoma vivax (strain Y486) TaxID=1055687 RepID=G0U3L5_TRYVY|nr:hypothetical protein, unlikely [Trypanosoma vivax Y486]